MPKVKIGPLSIWPSTIGFVVVTFVLSGIDWLVRYKSFEELKVESGNDARVTFSSMVVPALQLVPSQFIYFPWTLLTEPYVDSTFFQLSNAPTVFYWGVEYLENNWNPEVQGGAGAGGDRIFGEAVHYLVLTGSITTAITTILKTTFSLLGFIESSQLDLPLAYGVWTIVMSFVVAIKQLSPEYNVKLLKRIKFRLKRLPFIVLSVALLYSIAWTQSVEPFLMPLFINFYVSWVYLRYYQIHNVGGVLPTTSAGTTVGTTVRGDASDTFAFVQFFPDAWQPYLKPVSKFFYHSSVFLGLFRPFNDDDIESSNLRTIQRLNGGNASEDTDSEADRRKRVALKVLEQRVASDSQQQ